MSAGIAGEQLDSRHKQCAERAMAAMHRETLQAKAMVLQGGDLIPVAPRDQTRVAIYDHFDGSANGPKQLTQFLTPATGFHCRTITPQGIRDGVPAAVDVLIMPGGSGSKQSEKLQADGREAIRRFVYAGGDIPT